MAEAGGDVIGVDWRLPLDEAGRSWDRSRHPGQPRSDAASSDPRRTVRRRRRRPAPRAGAPGHIFNLGPRHSSGHAARTGAGISARHRAVELLSRLTQRSYRSGLTSCSTLVALFSSSDSATVITVVDHRRRHHRPRRRLRAGTASDPVHSARSIVAARRPDSHRTRRRLHHRGRDPTRSLGAEAGRDAAVRGARTRPAGDHVNAAAHGVRAQGRPALSAALAVVLGIPLTWRGLAAITICCHRPPRARLAIEPLIRERGRRSTTSRSRRSSAALRARDRRPDRGAAPWRHPRRQHRSAVDAIALSPLLEAEAARQRASRSSGAQRPAPAGWRCSDRCRRDGRARDARIEQRAAADSLRLRRRGNARRSG